MLWLCPIAVDYICNPLRQFTLAAAMMKFGILGQHHRNGASQAAIIFVENFDPASAISASVNVEVANAIALVADGFKWPIVIIISDPAIAIALVAMVARNRSLHIRTLSFLARPE